MKKDFNFDNFVEQYKIAKTIRFELRPIRETAEKIRENNELTIDKQRADAYQQVLKPALDVLHRKFIDESLAEVKLQELSTYFLAWKKPFKLRQQIYSENTNTKKSNKKKDPKITELRTELSQAIKELGAASRSLRQEIVKYFEQTGDLWKEKYQIGGKDKGYQVLLSKHIIKVLLKEFPENEDAIRKFEKFTTALTKFQETRKNIYSDKDQGTAISNRCINENLDYFCQNIEKYQRAKKVGIQFGKIQFCKPKKHLDELFALDLQSYNYCLIQDGIREYNKVIGEINQQINLHNQQRDKDDASTKVKILRNLYKQILAEDPESPSRAPEITSLPELRDRIISIATTNDKLVGNIEKKLIEPFFDESKAEDFDLAEIYIATRTLNSISTELYTTYAADSNEDLEKYTPSWALLKTLLSQDENLSKKISEYANRKKNDDTYQVISFEELRNALENAHLEEYHSSYHDFMVRLHNHFKKCIGNIRNGQTVEIDGQEERYGSKEDLEKLAETFDQNNQQHVMHLRCYLENANELARALKWFSIRKREKKEEKELLIETDLNFYQPWLEYFPPDKESFNIAHELSACRNYLTKKPYSEDKFKLYFQTPNLAEGWDQNVESQKKSVIFRKHGIYFLGIIAKGESNILDSIKHPEVIGKKDTLEKMVYKSLADAKKQIPRIAFSSKIKNAIPSGFTGIENIIEDYRNFQKKKKDSDAQNQKFDEKKSKQLIDYYKEVLKKHPEKYVKNYNLQFKAHYVDIKDFFDDMQRQVYKLSLTPINEEYIKEKIEAGQLYLFQIYNKDFSTKNPELEKAIANLDFTANDINESAKKRKKANDNLHTIYFKLLFDKHNLEKLIFKLSGGAELFRRNKSLTIQQQHEERNGQADSQLTTTTVHPKNKAIANKWLNESKPKSTFKYDIIKDRRFTEDKFFLHLSMEINYSKAAMENTFYYNKKINLFLHEKMNMKNASHPNIIGIDRGEKNLLYYSVINIAGEIIEQGSLNTIEEVLPNERTVDLDYQSKLHAKQVDRQNERKKWQTISGIRNLKQGYLSKVVHKLGELVVQYNAIVVLEDLNMRFKQIRSGIEMSVYQQFEQAMINKLGYLVFKREKKEKPGSPLLGYQLTGPVTAFKDLTGQTGIVFYTAASYTSITDPVTGFSKNIYLNPSMDKNKLKEIFTTDHRKGGIAISYNEDEFTFEYNPFLLGKLIKRKGIKNDTVSSQSWQIHSTVDRYTYNKQSKKSEKRNITENLENLFRKNNIKYQNTDINQEIKDASGLEKNFYVQLIYNINLLLKLRNTNEDGSEDFIQSPVQPFFDSRKIPKGDGQLPQDSDANGAYNIARKGIIILNKIKNMPLAEDKIKTKWDIKVRKEEWFKYTTQKEIVAKQKKIWVQYEK